MLYVTNGFSPSMLKLPANVEFKEVDKEEFCGAVNRGVNAIGHAGTIDLVNNLCGIALSVNRISITAAVGDEIYIIMLATRLEEGKVLKAEEIQRMYNEGKVRLVKAKVYGAVLEELSDCQGVCDEATYDTLSYKTKTVSPR